jgi:hypothetical protein
MNIPRERIFAIVFTILALAVFANIIKWVVSPPVGSDVFWLQDE